MKIITLLSFISVTLISSLCLGQKYEVMLNSPERLNSRAMQIEIFTDTPSENLILPKINLKKLKYFTLYYSDKTENDNRFSVVVDQKDDRDVLYIDRNNDEDLTNDGEPIDFYYSQDSVYLDFQPEKDPKQILRLFVYRTPTLDDSIKYNYIDSLGNMSKKSTDFWSSMLSKPEFEGQRGTFYYVDRITMRKGILQLDDKSYQIGLFDFSNNGLYNDDDDLLMIDYNQNNVLNYHDKEEIFAIADAIEINGEKYQIDFINKYGNKIVLKKNNKLESNYFVSPENVNENGFKQLNDNFWKSSLLGFNESVFHFEQLKGRHILLNFWGEWCKPCISEVDSLIKIRKDWDGKLTIVSILKTYNLDKAKRFVLERNIDWRQLILDDDFEKKFKIYGYPTNILIDPSGKYYLDTGVITESFISKYVK